MGSFEFKQTHFKLNTGMSEVKRVKYTETKKDW